MLTSFGKTYFHVSDIAQHWNVKMRFKGQILMDSLGCIYMYIEVFMLNIQPVNVGKI